jgi:PKD repeat protein
VREANGTIRTLVDGSKPTAASLQLIDVNAPDVSYDGRTIVFAGFPATEFDPTRDTRHRQNPDSWRLYVINSDGSGLRQLTFSDQDNLTYSQFGLTASGALKGYDDTDPAWLPDGRIVFSSTRWPAFGQYSSSRTSNLYVVRSDGGGLHRITSEKNGADRPEVDPVTGKIVFSRWWRNQRFATNSMDTVRNYDYPCCDGYERKDGLTRDRDRQLGGGDFLFRNSWHSAFINPDGTGLAQFAGPHQRTDGVHAYGGAFDPNGDFVANYFPMTNMTEAAGFGGLRRYKRGEIDYVPVIGVTARYQNGYEDVVSQNPISYGVVKGNYAGEPAVLADRRIVISWALDIKQDYGLYLIDPDGGGRTLLYDQPGTTELQAKVLQARALPPLIPDTVTPNASLLPPTAAGPYDIDGTFIFDALNVYGNGPVDSIQASAPRVGSAKKIRFFADFQRINWGSLETLDWPILLGEREIAGDGSVREPSAPANIPLFEQIRSADGTVPFTLGQPGGAAHVAGMNYGKPGAVMRCIGCHSGHTMIPVPESDSDAKWSNLAPGADVRVSSATNSTGPAVVDRQVMKGDIWRSSWYSGSGQTAGQWVELTFPEPISVRTVRLYNVRLTEGSTLQVLGATVRLGYPGSPDWIATQAVGALAVSGTDVSFPDVKARTVRVEVGSATGRSYNGAQVVGLGEIEVIGRAGEFTPNVNLPPDASFVASPATGQAPLNVTLDGSGSRDPDGSIVAYNWTFDDGSTAIGMVTQHVFTTEGSRLATLTVKDNLGATNTDTANVLVQPAIDPDPDPDPGIATLGVEQLSVSLSKRTHGSWVGTARATINLSDGSPAPGGVTVEGYWELDGKKFLRTASVRTDHSGVATVLSSRFRASSGAQLSFTVTKVAGSGLVWDEIGQTATVRVP